MLAAYPSEQYTTFTAHGKQRDITYLACHKQRDTSIEANLYLLLVGIHSRIATPGPGPHDHGDDLRSWGCYATMGHHSSGFPGDPCLKVVMVCHSIARLMWPQITALDACCAFSIMI